MFFFLHGACPDDGNTTSVERSFGSDRMRNEKLGLSWVSKFSDQQNKQTNKTKYVEFNHPLLHTFCLCKDKLNLLLHLILNVT